MADEGIDRFRVYADDDRDGFGDPAVSRDVCRAEPGFVPNRGDCDDANAKVNPDQKGYGAGDAVHVQCADPPGTSD